MENYIRKLLTEKLHSRKNIFRSKITSLVNENHFKELKFTQKNVSQGVKYLFCHYGKTFERVKCSAKINYSLPIVSLFHNSGISKIFMSN